MKFPSLLLHLTAFVALGIANPITQPVTTTTTDTKVSYDGYKVYRVTLGGSTAEIDASIDRLAAIELRRRRRNGDGSDEIWSVDLAVAPDHVVAFEAAAAVGRGDKVLGSTTVLSDDLGAEFAAESENRYVTAAEKQDESGKSESESAILPSLDWFDAYHAYADHVKYWADLQAAFPNNSELIVAGTSFEGRLIQGIHLWGKGGKDSKPAIFFNGNVHAREWITSKVSSLFFALFWFRFFSFTFFVVVFLFIIMMSVSRFGRSYKRMGYMRVKLTGLIHGVT